MMNFTVTGLNHKSAPVGLRQRLAVGASEVPVVLESLRRAARLQEVAILSTCNRVEVYARGEGTAPDPREVADALAAERGVQPEDFAPYFYSYSGEEAVRHLCRVACGIDSMVVGETDILGQVREAFSTSAANGAAGKFFSNLFQTVFATAKTVHTQTGISKNKVSVGSVAVDLAERLFDDLSDKSVLVIGAGDMGKVTLAHLAQRGVGAIVLVNRTYESAVELAEKFGAKAVHIDEVLDYLMQADIVIGASGAPHLIIRPERVRDAMRHRPDREMFLIDIAVPCDIDPEVAEIEGVHLYDIDSLRKIVDENSQARQAEVERCREIIDESVARFAAQWRDDSGRVIGELNACLEDMRHEEVEKVFRKLGETDPAHRELIEKMSRRLTRRFLHAPLSAIGAAEDEKREALLRAVSELFDLE